MTGLLRTLAAVIALVPAVSRGDATTGCVRVSLMGGLSDVRTDDYCVDGDAASGLFSFRPPSGAPEWMRLAVAAKVNGRELPAFVLSNGETRVISAVSPAFVYTNAEATAELTFRANRVVLALTLHRASPAAVRDVEIGCGSRTDSGQVFDPSVRYMPYHEFPIAEPCEIRPALASPPPWLFSYRREGRTGCWSAALEPEAERIDFASFEHVPADGGHVAWAVRYPVVEPRAGDFAVPPLVFRFGDADAFAALARHVADIRVDGKMIVPERRLPAWHAERIACTWRYQSKSPRREQANEANCEAYVRMLEDNGISFGTLIVDDFWGREHGVWQADPAKWKDLRGFIDRQHRKGRHVILWICTDGEGLPEDERIGNIWNPESPAFLARLRASARRMLSSDPGCYDADGVKFDFTAAMPEDCRGLRHTGCGFIRERFRVVSEAMRAVKPDALLDYQCTNPYFTHTLTMLRLNDYFGVPEHGLGEMRLRARIAAICAPGALIDTDHVSFREFSYSGGYDFFRQCREFGVESLYLGEAEMKDAELLSILKGKGVER